MKINLRWFVQAGALIFGIYFFKQLFERSKELLFSFSAGSFLVWIIFFLLFGFCFFLLMFTSYLKERGNNTLKNPIVFFEKLVSLFGLAHFTERRALNEIRRNGKSAAADPQDEHHRAAKNV